MGQKLRKSRYYIFLVLFIFINLFTFAQMFCLTLELTVTVQVITFSFFPQTMTMFQQNQLLKGT